MTQSNVTLPPINVHVLFILLNFSQHFPDEFLLKFSLILVYVYSMLAKFRLFENSIAGDPRSSNFGTRLYVVICMHE